MESFIGFLVSLLVAAVVLMIVDKFNVGLKVGGFVNAVIAALVVAVVGALVMWLLGVFGITIGGGILGAIVQLVVSAIILLIAGSLLPGFELSGFVGALIASVAIAVVYWLIEWVLSLFM